MTTEQTEIWKDIAGYKGSYQISNPGRVRGLTRRVFVKDRENGRIFTGRVKCGCREKKNGYRVVSPCCKGKSKRSFTHRLAASTFTQNHNNLPQVNRKDEDKTNNKAPNLEWCDTRYNTNYRNYIEKRITPQRKRVSQITLDSAYIRSFASMAEIERGLGFNHSAVCICCKGNTKSAYGYKWEYAE